MGPNRAAKSLDTNRVTVHSETLYKAANTISLKADSFYSDSLMWILTTAVCMRTLRILVISALIPETGAYALLAFLLVPPLLLICYVFNQANGSHTLAAFYRTALITTGLVLGII